MKESLDMGRFEEVSKRVKQKLIEAGPEAFPDRVAAMAREPLAEDGDVEEYILERLYACGRMVGLSNIRSGFLCDYMIGRNKEGKLALVALERFSCEARASSSVVSGYVELPAFVEIVRSLLHGIAVASLEDLRSLKGMRPAPVVVDICDADRFPMREPPRERRKGPRFPRHLRGRVAVGRKLRPR